MKLINITCCIVIGAIASYGVSSLMQQRRDEQQKVAANEYRVCRTIAKNPASVDSDVLMRETRKCIVNGYITQADIDRLAR